jgi:hypothetical protein
MPAALALGFEIASKHPKPESGVASYSGPVFVCADLDG